jgi:hypothetical protein
MSAMSAMSAMRWERRGSRRGDGKGGMGGGDEMRDYCEVGERLGVGFFAGRFGEIF